MTTAPRTPAHHAGGQPLDVTPDAARGATADPGRAGVGRRSLLGAGALMAATGGLGGLGLGAQPAAAAGIRPTAGRAHAATVLFHEDFDSIASPTGFTHDAPQGWTNEAHGFRTGEGRWSGWTFTNVRDWTWAAGTDERHWFPLGFGVLAVLESEHHRLDQESDDMLNATLTTPSIPVRGRRQVELAFASHYRQGRAGQSAAVTVSFDGGRPRDLLVYTEDRYSHHEEILVDVPTGARTVQFAWEYRNGHNDKWWAIDEIEVREPLPPLPADARPLTIIDVVSDIHVSEDSARYDLVVDQLNAMTPQASALVVNGDAVELGVKAHYDQWAAAVAANPHTSGEVLISVGNHEMLGDEGSDVYLARYLKIAGEQKPYFERVVDGVPLIVTGTEYYADREREGREPYNNFSAEQLRWLDGRLKHWQKRGQAVMLFNHFPLPYTVSQTHSSWEQHNYEDVDAFNAVVGKYTNILMFTGHTHDDLHLGDWWGHYRVADPKAPAGFPVVNTGAVLNAYVPSGDVDTDRVPGDHSSGLRVSVYADRIRVVSYDFVNKEQISSHDFALGALTGR